MISKIFLGIGANLKFNKSLSIQENCLKVIDSLDKDKIFIKNVSNWYKSSPVPSSNQPWLINSVVEISTNLNPSALMEYLHSIEITYGRKRKVLNGDRTIDIDILDYNGITLESKNLLLPHPQIKFRKFILKPWTDISPDYILVSEKKTIKELLDDLSDLKDEVREYI